MFETLVSFTMIEHLCGSIFDPPLGPPEYPRVTSEARRPYRTRDGYIGVMIYNDKHWRAFFAALGDPERSEEHTSELQSLMRISYAIFCLKKKIRQLHSTKRTNHGPQHKTITSRHSVVNKIQHS